MMSRLLFPNLTPKLVDSLWFNVDQPCDDENEVAQLELEHQQWLNYFQQKDSDLVPIGKTASEVAAVDDDEEEEDEDDNDDDDDTESHDDEEEDEVSMEISYERNSPVDVSIRMVQGHGVR